MPGTAPTNRSPRRGTTTPASVPAAPLSGSGSQAAPPPQPQDPAQPHGRWVAEVEEQEQSVDNLEHLLDGDDDEE